MAYNGFITYNNIASSAYPLTMTAPPQTTRPELITEEYTIPGRNGKLYGVDSYQGSAQITINLALVADDTFTNQVSAYTVAYRQVRQWLRGTGRLIISDAPDAFYEVQKVEIITDERLILRYGNLQAVFTVYPVEFLTSGETAIAAGTINNPGSEAAPLYKITGTGSGVLTVNGKTMSYTAAGVLFIDTRRFIAYDGSGNNKNNQVAGDYLNLRLQPGENTVAATAGTLAIYPRWGFDI